MAEREGAATVEPKHQCLQNLQRHNQNMDLTEKAELLYWRLGPYSDRKSEKFPFYRGQQTCGCWDEYGRFDETKIPTEAKEDFKETLEARFERLSEATLKTFKALRTQATKLAELTQENPQWLIANWEGVFNKNRIILREGGLLFSGEAWFLIEHMENVMQETMKTALKENPRLREDAKRIKLKLYYPEMSDEEIEENFKKKTLFRISQSYVDDITHIEVEHLTKDLYRTESCFYPDVKERWKGKIQGHYNLTDLPNAVVETAIVLYGDGGYETLSQAIKAAKALEE